MTQWKFQFINTHAPHTTILLDKYYIVPTAFCDKIICLCMERFKLLWIHLKRRQWSCKKNQLHRVFSKELYIFRTPICFYWHPAALMICAAAMVLDTIHSQSYFTVVGPVFIFIWCLAHDMRLPSSSTSNSREKYTTRREREESFSKK
jgi:hypothetical protein